MANEMELNVGIGDELVTTPADEILDETEIADTSPSMGKFIFGSAIGTGITMLIIEGGKVVYKKAKKAIFVHKARKEAGKVAAQVYDAEQEQEANAAKKGVNKK